MTLREEILNLSEAKFSKRPTRVEYRQQIDDLESKGIDGFFDASMLSNKDLYHEYRKRLNNYSRSANKELKKEAKSHNNKYKHKGKDKNPDYEFIDGHIVKYNMLRKI